MDDVPENKMEAVNFSCLVFCLLDFLTLEGETDMLFRNTGEALPLYAA